MGNISEENLAAWLHGVNDIKIQPFKLPTLGTFHFINFPFSMGVFSAVFFFCYNGVFSWDIYFYKIGAHDVRVSMKAVGICGSDVHYLKVKLISLFFFFFKFIVIVEFVFHNGNLFIGAKNGFIRREVVDIMW